MCFVSRVMAACKKVSRSRTGAIPNMTISSPTSRANAHDGNRLQQRLKHVFFFRLVSRGEGLSACVMCVCFISSLVSRWISPLFKVETAMYSNALPPDVVFELEIAWKFLVFVLNNFFLRFLISCCIVTRFTSLKPSFKFYCYCSYNWTDFSEIYCLWTDSFSH